MPIELQIIRAQEFIRLGAHGRFDLQASKTVLAQLAAACRKRGINQALLDLRSLHPGPKPVFSPKDLVVLVNTFRDVGFTPQERLAVLYSDDPHRRARMFAKMAKQRGWSVQAFDSFEEAVIWLSAARTPGAEVEAELTPGPKQIPVRTLKAVQAATKPAFQPTIQIRSSAASRRQAVFVKGGKKKSAGAVATLVTLLLVAMMSPALAASTDNDVSNEYRTTVAPHHEIIGDLTGFGQLEYRNNPESNYQAYEVLWPGLIYSVKDWFQVSGGLVSLYTDNQHKADELELRPFAGIKLLLPNKMKWNLYNYTRYEYRDTQDIETQDWTEYSRLRSRFGVEVPFTSSERAWQPKTWYGLADVEPIYRFDHDQIDPLYVRGGFGYILSQHLSLEFIYYAEFTRPSQSSSLQHTENIFQVNLKIGFSKGILQRLHNPTAAD